MHLNSASNFPYLMLNCCTLIKWLGIELLCALDQNAVKILRFISTYVAIWHRQFCENVVNEIFVFIVAVQKLQREQD